MAYSNKVLDHYENPRNVGVMDKSDQSVGTGMVGAPACLHGDTLVAMADGRRNIPIRELAETGEDVQIYAWDDTGYHIENGYKPRLTRTRAHCLKVIFDDESFIIGTDDHELYKGGRRGHTKRYPVPFSDLKTGDSVHAFSRRLESGYMRIQLGPKYESEVQAFNHEVLRVEDYGYSDVYCLTTEYSGCFAVVTSTSDSVDSGVLVSNCGDVMRLQIKVNKQGIIEDAKFKTYGCGSAIASSSLVTEWIKGKTLDDAMTIKNSHIAEELELPPVKIHCSVLAEDAIKAAVEDYRAKHSTDEG